MDQSTGFVDHNPTLDTYWRSIVLLGRNVASYKFALAKTLLEIPQKNNLILLEELALPFAKNVSDHLIHNDRQIYSPSSKFLDYCRQFNRGEINEEELRSYSARFGFINVIDAFHNVDHNETPRFFIDARKNQKGLELTDNFYNLFESSQGNNLTIEVDARWRLWETALSLNINPNLLEINSDLENESLYVINDSLRRIDVTSSRDALNGYQKGKCFYCYRDIQIQQGLENSCDVDHFFPHILKQSGFHNVDQIWNLVLSCRDCNRGSGGKFESIPMDYFLPKLYTRNNFYIESHHPLRETIINQTGRTKEQRLHFLNRLSLDVGQARPTLSKWQPPKS